MSEFFRIFGKEGAALVEFNRFGRVFQLEYTLNAIFPEWEYDALRKLAQKRDEMLRGEIPDELEGPFARYATYFSTGPLFDEVIPVNWRDEIKKEE